MLQAFVVGLMIGILPLGLCDHRISKRTPYIEHQSYLDSYSEGGFQSSPNEASNIEEPYSADYSSQNYEEQSPENPSDNNGFRDNNEQYNENNVDSEAVGIPGQDFPTFNQVPSTNFQCSNQPFPGYYSDVETDCQVFHVCHKNGGHSSFICPNSSLFNQKYLVCDWWFNVDCQMSTEYYQLNSQLFVDPSGHSRAYDGSHANGPSRYPEGDDENGHDENRNNIAEGTAYAENDYVDNTNHNPSSYQNYEWTPPQQ